MEVGDIATIGMIDPDAPGFDLPCPGLVENRPPRQRRGMAHVPQPFGTREVAVLPRRRTKGRIAHSRTLPTGVRPDKAQSAGAATVNGFVTAMWDVWPF